MKRAMPSAFVLLLSLCAFLFALPAHSHGASDGGRIVIKHSPLLGINVAVVVRIDGQHAGVFTKGHVFDRYVSEGRHVLGVFRNGREGDSFRTVLQVRPGETYVFVAKYRVDQLVLERVYGRR